MPSRRSLSIASVVLAALVVGFGNSASPEGTTSDTLISILVSLQRWTPWMWGNDHRFGQLVPALTLWATTPAMTFAAQTTLTAGAGFAAIYAIGAYLELPAQAAPAAATFWLLVDRHVGMNWLAMSQSYSVSVALGVAAMLVIGKRWWATHLAAALIALAFWVNSGVGTILIPLWLARQVLLEKQRRGYELIAVALVASVQVAEMAYLRHVSSEPRYTQTVPLSMCGNAVAWAAGRIREAGRLWLSIVALVGFPRTRRQSALVALAAMTLIPVAINAWVYANLEDPRYFVFPMIAMTLSAGAGLPARAWLWRGPPTALPLMAVAVFGLPSLGGVRQQLLEMAPQAKAIDESRCTLLVGPYWQMWPNLIGALQLRLERGDQLPLYGLGVHGEGAMPLIQAMPQDEINACRMEGS